MAEEYPELLRASSQIDIVSSETFGEQIVLYTGSLEFLQTDLSLRGNNALEVAVRRRFKAGSGEGGFGGFGDWTLAIPHMHGVFSSKGWKAPGSDSTKRCSAFGAPPPEPGVLGGFFDGGEFWHGTFLYMPEAGDLEVLKRTTQAQPLNGYAYPLRTKNGVAIRCVPQEGGSAEAFEALTPDGVAYRFDHLASIVAPSVNKFSPEPDPSLSSSQSAMSVALAPNGYLLQRREYFLLPTQARDRFGNTVSYSWNSANALQLLAISSSDGRSISFAYGADGNISTITHGTKQWLYTYSNGSLSNVELPDSSSWGIALQPLAARFIASSASCGWAGSGAPASATGSITHPSGAKATYTLKSTKHGRSWSGYYCTNDIYPDYGYEYYPAEFLAFSISAKTLSGGAMSTMSWTYTYSAANGCYNNASAPIVCQTSSPDEKWVDVKDPAGVTTRHVFGNRYNVDEGLLKEEVSPLRTVLYTYAAPSAGPYPDTAGNSYQPRGGGTFESKHLPLKERVFRQDGHEYRWKVSAFDTFVRPTTVVRSGGVAP